MKRIICFIIGHEWSKWRYIKAVGRYDEMLKRRCKRCHCSKFFVGLTKLSKEGNKIPDSK